MKNLQNLHTHTYFCDGDNSPEEIVISAMEKGFESIGFSIHAYMFYSPFYVKRGDKTNEYKLEIKRLKEKYKNDIDIYMGMEFDLHSGVDMNEYDYLIGALHYLKINDNFIGFDKNADSVETIINEYFDGDGMKYAKAYYESIAKLPEYGKFDILAHFDLITKHIDNKDFFDINSKEYLKMAFEAAESLAGKIPFFEVNTGAIARGFRKTPYPDLTLVKELKRLGFGAVISSDCHNKDMLDYYFDEAREILKECGFKEKYILTKEGFSAVAL